MATDTKFTRRNRITIYLMLLGSFLGGIDQTILSPALPSIMTDLHIDAVAGQWLTTIFLLINGIMVPCTAYLMARFTTRQLYLTAMGIFGFGSLIAGLSSTFFVLLCARVLQALGFGILMPLLTASILMVYPPSQHGKAMGMIGLVFSVAPAIGPSMAGFIVDSYGWNYIFLLLAALVLVDVILSAIIMPKDGTVEHIPLDVKSVIMSSIGFGGLLYSFSCVGSHGWLSPHFILPLLIGSVTLYYFIKRQDHLETPLLSFQAFKNKQFTVGAIIAMVMNAVLLFGMVLTPIYLQDIHGYSALMSALIMLPSALLSAFINLFVGHLYDRYGGREIILSGLLIITLGSIFYAFFQKDSSLPFLVISYSIRIIGINIVMTPITTWSMAPFRGDAIPHANALLNTMRQIAGSIGTAIFVSIYTIMQHAVDGPLLEGSLIGIRVAFGVSAVVSALAFILAYYKVDKQQRIKVIKGKRKSA